MHDLGLGGPVPVERDKNAKHSGQCYDGVYGCHLCWNADNGGKGMVFECDWCHKELETRVVKAWDEPVMYALCEKCRKKNHPEVEDDFLVSDLGLHDDLGEDPLAGH